MAGAAGILERAVAEAAAVTSTSLRERCREAGGETEEEAGARGGGARAAKHSINTIKCKTELFKYGTIVFIIRGGFSP